MISGRGQERLQRHVVCACLTFPMHMKLETGNHPYIYWDAPGIHTFVEDDGMTDAKGETKRVGGAIIFGICGLTRTQTCCCCTKTTWRTFRLEHDGRNQVVYLHLSIHYVLFTIYSWGHVSCSALLNGQHSFIKGKIKIYSVSAHEYVT